MKIDKHRSKIGHFKEIIAIVDDPQNVKNDISTFAGRMIAFSKLFGKNHFITGIDEIELGTDSDEAASLFKVILEKLIHKDIKIIITTHHKRLASMMAVNDEVELMAALYDEVNRKPTYEFLQGTIGKSYAFETALRYGIASSIVAEAKEVYGKDKEKLNDLIQKNIELEWSDTLIVSAEDINYEEEKELKLNALKSILNRITDKCKRIFELFYFQNLSMKDIAEQLNFTTVNSAKTQKYKCMEKAIKLAKAINVNH